MGAWRYSRKPTWHDVRDYKESRKLILAVTSQIDSRECMHFITRWWCGVHQVIAVDYSLCLLIYLPRTCCYEGFIKLSLTWRALQRLAIWFAHGRTGWNPKLHGRVFQKDRQRRFVTDISVTSHRTLNCDGARCWARNRGRTEADSVESGAGR